LTEALAQKAVHEVTAERSEAVHEVTAERSEHIQYASEKERNFYPNSP
jgi:hypothetical protein